MRRSNLNSIRLSAFAFVFCGLLSSLVLPLSGTSHAASVRAESSTSAIERPQTTAPPALTQEQAQQAYGKVGMSFEANQGQTDEAVKFLARGSGYTLFLTQTEAVFVLANSDCASRNENTARGSLKSPDPLSATNQTPAMCNAQSAVLRMKLEGANSQSVISGLDELEGKVNYFIGSDPDKWHANIPTFGRVRYASVYEGVDMVYYGNQQQLEYDFVIKPGADYKQILLGFEGASKVEVDTASGDLLIQVGEQTLRQHKPVVYQEVNGERQEIESRYVQHGAGRIGFAVGAYDSQRALIIDPVLAYSTYLGGSGEDKGNGIAVDPAGNVYVTGSTASTNFPTSNAIQPGKGTGSDAFITKLNVTGTARVYSTYLGGNDDDIAFGIALDAAGNAYIAGATTSTNFPTQNAIQNAKNTGFDGFVTKLNVTGTALVYSTYRGGNDLDSAIGIAVDTSGNAYITGGTLSTDFPITAGAYDTTDNPGADAFVTKINASGTAHVYSTYLGGNGDDQGNGIVVDPAGNASVTGVTVSTNFPRVQPIQPAPGGNDDGFVTKFNVSGSALAYSTYLGGTNNDRGTAIAVDSAGNAYVTGFTASPNFPTANPLQPNLNGADADAFVTKINGSSGALIHSTYLGGSKLDRGNGITVDSVGNVYVTGNTYSTDFPTANAIQSTQSSGDAEVFVTKLEPAGPVITFSTYLGGQQEDIGNGIAVDSFGNVYVTGFTKSTDFPTANAIQSAGGSVPAIPDAFISKIGSFLISGRVTDASSNGISAVTVTLSGASAASTTTDASGNFSFVNTVSGGNYTVTPSGAGFTFNPASMQINNLNSNQELLFIGTAVSTPTPTPVPAPVTISGQVTANDGSGGISAVSMSLNGTQSASAVTDSAGNYSFPNLPASGSYTVFATKSGFSFTPPTQSFSNLNTNAFANFVGTAASLPTPTPTATPTPATVQFSASSFSANENVGQIEIIVTRSGDISQPLAVDYATTDGTANDRGDYTTAIGRLHFAAGDTAESFNVFIADDVFAEGNETVNLALSSPSSGAQISGAATAVLTIVDNDLVNGIANPIDSSAFFVRQHYLDFLNRAPDLAGLAFWTNNIEACGANANCRAEKRVDTSAAFFLSIEFQQTGFLVERAYQAAFNRFPSYRDFIRDTQQIGHDVVVGQGSWQAQLDANKQQFATDFVARPDFIAVYGGLSNQQYVDALNANTGNSLSGAERNALVAGLNGATETRASVLSKVTENAVFTQREFNRAFVLMQFFGYLRRNPNDAPDSDFSGYNFWLAKLNSFSGDFRQAELVKAFITSAEYRRRFGQP